MTQEPETTEEQPEKGADGNFPSLQEMNDIFLKARAKREKRLTRTVLALEALTVLAKKGVAMNLEWQLRPISQEQADMATKVMDVLYDLPIFQPDEPEKP